MKDKETTDEVTVCWGEEKISLKAYTSLSMGPFFYKTHRREDETPEQAFDRALRVVRHVAEKERDAKIKSYRKILAECD